jgi:DMSO reductase anchor subunit
MENRRKTIFFGVLIGAMTGLVAALLLDRRARQDANSTAITTGEGLQLGMMVVGLLRAISTLGDRERK